MRQAALDGAAGCNHGLPNHLAAEHPLPARLRAVAAEQVHLELLEIENGNQVNQALGHDGGAFNFGVIPGRLEEANPESRAKASGFRVRAGARPGMTVSLSTLFLGPVSPSYYQVASVV
jgi:hypothetical protein